MQGFFESILGYIILLIVWGIFCAILYFLSHLFKKNFSVIGTVIYVIVEWGIQIYLLGYGIYILWTLITAGEWIIFILAILFGAFILGFYQMVYSFLLWPFSMIALGLGVMTEKNLEEQEKHNIVNQAQEIIDVQTVTSEHIINAPKSKSESSMYCFNCGKEIHKDSNFCKHCGVHLKQHTSQPNDNYFNRLFAGRVNIRNFIVGNIFLFVWIFIISILDEIIQSSFNAEYDGVISTAALLLILFLGFVYGYSLLIRRLHDINHSGWFSLLNFVPVINLIFYLYLVVVSGSKEQNHYGAKPKPKISLKEITGF